jgi:hypothetical protein
LVNIKKVQQTQKNHLFLVNIAAGWTCAATIVNQNIKKELKSCHTFSHTSPLHIYLTNLSEQNIQHEDAA